MAEIKVHPRVSRRHPEVSDEDVVDAWSRFVRMTSRTGCYDDNYVAVGFDCRGRLLEMVAVRDKEGEWFVFHAMPATSKTLDELGLR